MPMSRFNLNAAGSLFTHNVGSLRLMGMHARLLERLHHADAMPRHSGYTPMPSSLAARQRTTRRQLFQVDATSVAIGAPAAAIHRFHQ